MADLRQLNAESRGGFSLLEVLVALAILSIAVGAYVGSVLYHSKQNYRAEVRAAAMQAAQQVVDQIRTLDPSTLPESGSEAPRAVAIDSRTFSVIVKYCENSSYCLNNDVRHLTVDVEYRDEAYYSVQTVFAKLR